MTEIFIFLILVVGAFVFIKHVSGGKEEKKPVDLSVYDRKRFLFDAVSELNLYKMLMELYGNDYRIFAQVQYSHLIEPKKSLPWAEQGKYRSRIDKKSADFVICHKDTVAPLLVIELDGSAHNQAKVQANDNFKNEITKVIGLPLIRLRVGNLTKEFVKNEIDKKML